MLHKGHTSRKLCELYFCESDCIKIPRSLLFIIFLWKILLRSQKTLCYKYHLLSTMSGQTLIEAIYLSQTSTFYSFARQTNAFWNWSVRSLILRFFYLEKLKIDFIHKTQCRVEQERKILSQECFLNREWRTDVPIFSMLLKKYQILVGYENSVTRY